MFAYDAGVDAALQTTARRRASRRLAIAIALAVATGVAFTVIAVKVATNSSHSLGTQSDVQLIASSPGHETVPGVATLQRLGGGAKVVVAPVDGKPYVVNFFASWCPACQRELGAIAAVAKTAPVRIVGVDTDDDSPGQALALLHRAGATYAVGIGNGTLAEKYGTANLPTTAFVNGHGQIVALALGALTKPDLEKWSADLAAGRPLGPAS